MKTVALVRVSTEKQSVESQRTAIERWSADKSVPIDEWVDEGEVSGAAPMDDREKFKALLDQATAKDSAVGRVVVTERSRLGRVADETLHHVMRLHRAGVTVVFLDDSYDYDWDDPMDLVRFFLGCAMDHGERLKTISRTKRSAVRRTDGRVRATKPDGSLGGVWGRPGPQVDELEAAQVDLALSKGDSVNGIAERGVYKTLPDGTKERLSRDAVHRWVRTRRRTADAVLQTAT